MLKPLEQFICDECGEIINSPKEGYVEQVEKLNEDGKWIARGFRIVHAYYASPRKKVNTEGCYRYGNESGRMDIGLDDFIQYAKQNMFSFLDKGVIYDRNGTIGCQIENFREFTEFFKRLIIPYYEEARFYLNEAYDDIYDINELVLYSEKKLKEIVEKYSRF